MKISHTRPYSINQIADEIFRSLWQLGKSRRQRIVIISRFLDVVYRKDERSKNFHKNKRLAAPNELEIRIVFNTFKQKCFDEVQHQRDEIERLEMYDQIRHDVLAQLQLMSIQLLGLDIRFKFYVSLAVVGLAATGTVGYLIWNKLSADRKQELVDELRNG